jgi:hypothetical protein
VAVVVVAAVAVTVDEKDPVPGRSIVALAPPEAGVPEALQ